MKSKFLLFILAVIILLNAAACSSGAPTGEIIPKESGGGLTDKTNENTEEINSADTILENKKISMVSVGDNHSFVVTTDGELYATGKNEYGQLGTGKKDEGTREFIKVMDNIKTANAVLRTGSFVVNNNSELLFWGYSDYFPGEALTPVKLMDNVEKVCVGACAVLILTKGGNLYGFGKNIWGELGEGSHDIIYEKPEIIAENVADMNVHYENLIYSTRSGEVFITQSEFNDKTGKSLPYELIKISDSGKSVSSGEWFFLFISDNNDLYGYGRNRLGNMGNGFEDFLIETTKLKSGVKKAWGDFDYSLIISTENILYGSGDGYRGNYIERGEEEYFAAEYTKIMDNVADISSNLGSNMLITTDGELYVSGYNVNGELGMGDIKRVDGFTKLNIR